MPGPVRADPVYTDPSPSNRCCCHTDVVRTPTTAVAPVALAADASLVVGIVASPCDHLALRLDAVVVVEAAAVAEENTSVLAAAAVALYTNTLALRAQYYFALRCDVALVEAAAVAEENAVVLPAAIAALYTNPLA